MTAEVEQVQATKRCAKCKADKSFQEFSKKRTNTDGYQKYCKACCKQYKQDNKGKLLAYQKKWCAENKEWLSEYGKGYDIGNYDKEFKSNQRLYNELGAGTSRESTYGNG